MTRATNENQSSTPSSLRDRSVGIVGAGLAGLVAARRLAQAGQSVVVIERGRSVGGRLATRTIGRAVFDHGAQFFTVRSDTFKAEVDRWLAAGVVAEWCRGFDEIDGYPRYRGEGGMAALARHLGDEARAAGANIVTGVTTTAAIPGPDGWTLTHDHWQREPDDVSAAILTAPAPEAVRLLAAGGLTAPTGIAEVHYHRVLALLVTLKAGATAPSLPACGATQQPKGDWFSFIADNKTKGISPEPALTFHTSHERSAALWDEDDVSVTEQLRGPAADAIGVDPADFGIVQLRRWRHAGPLAADPERYRQLALAGDEPLLICGDGFGGPKVEGAFLSGLAAADALLVSGPVGE